MLSVRVRRDGAVPGVISEDEEGLSSPGVVSEDEQGWAMSRAAFSRVSGVSGVGDFWESLKGHQ